MWKKIVLGIIISAVVLTVSAGGIYAYQKDSNYDNDAKTQSKNGYGINNASCTEQNCANEDCTEQYCNRESNCYRYNNDENGYQNCNNFCYQNSIKNQYNNQNCLQNGKSSPKGNNIKNSFGKNK